MLSLFATRRLFRTSAVLLDAERMSGSVKWFDNKKGFGFIAPNSGTTEEIFVHQTSIISATGYRMLQEVQSVSFERRVDKTGRAQAYEVKMADGSPVKNESTRN